MMSITLSDAELCPNSVLFYLCLKACVLPQCLHQYKRISLGFLLTMQFRGCLNRTGLVAHEAKMALLRSIKLP